MALLEMRYAGFPLLITALLIVGSGGLSEAKAQRIEGIGVRAGYGWTRLDTNLDRLDPGAGWIAGLFLPIRFDDAIVAEPELLYTRKGGQFDVRSGEGEVITTQYQLDYLEVPVRARLDFPIKGAIDARFGVGPYAALLLDHATDTQLEEEDLYTSRDFEDIDLGVVIDLGITLPLDARAVLLGVRIDYGLTDLLQEEEHPLRRADTEIYTRTLFFTAGIRF